MPLQRSQAQDSGIAAISELPRSTMPRTQELEFAHPLPRPDVLLSSVERMHCVSVVQNLGNIIRGSRVELGCSKVGYAIGTCCRQQVCVGIFEQIVVPTSVQ